MYRHAVSPRTSFLPPDDRFNKVHLKLRRTPSNIPRATVHLDSHRSLYKITGSYTTTGHNRSYRRRRLRLHIGGTHQKYLPTEGDNSSPVFSKNCLSSRNGLVERRHLELGLMAHENSTKWVQQLSLDLLGVRAALKQDVGCATSEFDYGTTLRLSSDLFEVAASTTTCHEHYTTKLKNYFADLRQVSMRAVSTKTPYLAQDLQTATHVFVRR